MNKVVDVAGAMIVRQGTVLIVKRKDGLRHWEFPGGKIEEGETPEKCIVREIKEELGIEIKVQNLVGETICKHGGTFIRLMVYCCSWESGTITLKEHSHLAWVKPETLDKYDLAPADRVIAGKLMSIERWLAADC